MKLLANKKGHSNGLPEISKPTVPYCTADTQQRSEYTTSKFRLEYVWNRLYSLVKSDRMRLVITFNTWRHLYGRVQEMERGRREGYH